MTMKPIEPGCLALITYFRCVPDLVGSECKVIEKDPYEAGYWFIEPNRSLLPPRYKDCIISSLEVDLLRIDGGEDLETVEERERELVK